MVCRQLLGPLPEEWDEFYAGMENLPPNPYKVKPAVIDKPIVTPPVEEKPAEHAAEDAPDERFDDGEADSGPRRFTQAVFRG